MVVRLPSRIAASLLGAVLVAGLGSGCVDMRSSAPQSSDALRFTVAPVSSPTSHSAAVTLNLRNTSDHTITWRRFAFGVGAQALSKVATGLPDGVSVGLSAPPGKFGVPLTLRSGESTSVVKTFGLGPGRWRVVAAYGGQGDGPDGRSKPIVVVVP
jgi:hypothetical protein